MEEHDIGERGRERGKPDQRRLGGRIDGAQFLAQRRRLELSQPEAGFLLNVSPQTIYNWETGKTRPKPEQIAVIAAMRKLSKTAARAIVDGAKR